MNLPCDPACVQGKPAEPYPQTERLASQWATYEFLVTFLKTKEHKNLPNCHSSVDFMRGNSEQTAWVIR